MTRHRPTAIMPPLLEEEMNFYKEHEEHNDNRFNGGAAEHVIKFILLQRGQNFYDPAIDNGIDLLVLKDGSLLRGQTKKVVCKMKPAVGGPNSTDQTKRPCFDFLFQSGSARNGNPQRTPEDVDVFYHVLITKHRTLVFETPSSVITLRKDGDYAGTFVHMKQPLLDRTSANGPAPDIDFGPYLIYSQYSPLIFEKFPEFFRKQPTLEQFFTS
jgi:hypothetical protein